MNSGLSDDNDHANNEWQLLSQNSSLGVEKWLTHPHGQTVSPTLFGLGWPGSSPTK
jgi:hypothetical protein